MGLECTVVISQYYFDFNKYNDGKKEEKKYVLEWQLSVKVHTLWL